MAKSLWNGLIAVVLLALAEAACARDVGALRLSAARAAAVDAAVGEEMRKEGVVGLAVGVIENDAIVYLKGYGFADREARVAVNESTMFRWASVSKPVTAIAAMQLIERGKLDLDADVRRYVPEFPDKGVTITLHQLLDHQSGIVHYDNGPVVRTEKKYTDAHPFLDVINALDKFKESPLVNAPGEKYSYSSYGYVLASAVVQRAGGQAYIAQVRERIIGPLGLSSMQPDYPWIDIAHRAAGYWREGAAIVRSSDTDVSWKLGAGGFISDIGDFAGFAKALIDRRLVSQKSEALMWTAQPLRSGEATHYGLGFEVDSNKGRLRIAHDGAQEKTRTRLVIYPRERRGVVIMTNSEWVNPSKFSTLVFSALSTPETGSP